MINSDFINLTNVHFVNKRDYHEKSLVIRKLLT